MFGLEEILKENEAHQYFSYTLFVFLSMELNVMDRFHGIEFNGSLGTIGISGLYFTAVTDFLIGRQCTPRSFCVNHCFSWKEFLVFMYDLTRGKKGSLINNPSFVRVIWSEFFDRSI